MKLQTLLVPALLVLSCASVFALLLLVTPPAPPEPAATTVASAEPAAVEAPSPDVADATAAPKSAAPLPAAPEAPSEGPFAAGPVTPPPSASTEPTAVAPLPQDIRNVSPDGVSAPRVSGSLKRVEPSKRYLELKDPPIKPIPEGPLEFARVQILDSGHLMANKLSVKLAHIIPLKASATCASDDGKPWPCGTRARTFLRGLVRQFKLTCKKVEELGPQEVLATCTKGRIDLSKQLVRYGWVDPAPGAPAEFEELARKAKDRKLGRWRTEWPTDLPRSDLETSAITSLPGLESFQQEVVDWSLPPDAEQPLSDDFLNGFGEARGLPDQ